MHVEYDITEQDFLHALQLVDRRTTPSVVRWFELASPFLGFALLIFTIYRLATQGLSGLFVLCLGMGLYLLFIPLLSKNRQKQLYRNRDFLHRKLVLEVEEVGLRFGGETGAWKSAGGRSGGVLRTIEHLLFCQKGGELFRSFQSGVFPPLR